jgi:AcrR family transcriptional regulator
MARRRSAGFDDQREAILAAAARCFADQGYTATTMQQVAAECGVSKALLYHYVRDKRGLVYQISLAHVVRLEALVADVQARVSQAPAASAPPPQALLQGLIEAFTSAYAEARHEHRVLTEDVKFLLPEERQAVIAAQRRVVRAFAEAIQAVRPEVADQELHTPLAMLLFGMINWTFTWLKPDGVLTHHSLAPLVSELFLGGLEAITLPAVLARPAPRAPVGRQRARELCSGAASGAPTRPGSPLR